MKRAKSVDRYPLGGSDRVVRVGTAVVAFWGGTDGRSGTRRTTEGIVKQIWSNGKMKLDRSHNKLRDANVHYDDLKAIL